MIILTVGLQEIQDKRLDWDEDTSSDLVNQFGKKIEQIGRLQDSQKTDALMRLQRGGFIRWHTLGTEQRILSTTYRNSCMNMFWITVGLEEHGPGVIPVILENNRLSKLVRDLGSDLEQLGKLKSSQVAEVGYGLENAGFVECFEMREVNQDSPPVLQGDCNIDIAQPTPSPPVALYLPMVDPKTSDPANDTLQFDFEPDPWNSWTDNMYTWGGYPGSDIDALLDTTLTPDEIVALRGSDTIPLGTPHPASGISSPAETTSTPGLHGGVSSYSTPSTTYVDSPQMGEQLLPRLGATMLNQAVKRKRRGSDRSMQSKSIAAQSNPTIFQLLQSCAFYKVDKPEEDRFQKALSILKAENHLSMDPCRMLQPLLGGQDKNMSLNFYALGLPAVWRGKEGAVNYIRLLDRHKTQSRLHPITERLAQVLLYLSYTELCEHQKKYNPHSSEHDVKSFVLNCIIDAYHDDPRKSMPPQSRRDKISGYHVRRGRRWWNLAGPWGVGILLVEDGSLMKIMCNDSFSILQINALVTFVLNARPGTIRIFRALEPVVKSLVFEQVTDDLTALFNDESGLLGQNELVRAHAEDEAALACQQIENPWTEVDADECADAKVHEFVNMLAT